MFQVRHADGGQYHLISREGHGIKLQDSIRRKQQTAHRSGAVPNNAKPFVPISSDSSSGDDETGDNTVIVGDGEGSSAEDSGAEGEEAGDEVTVAELAADQLGPDGTQLRPDTHAEDTKAEDAQAEDAQAEDAQDEDSQATQPEQDPQCSMEV